MMDETKTQPEKKRISLALDRNQLKLLSNAALASGRSESDILIAGGMYEANQILRNEVMPLLNQKEGALFKDRMSLKATASPLMLAAALSRWSAENDE